MRVPNSLLELIISKIPGSHHAPYFARQAEEPWQSLKDSLSATGYPAADLTPDCTPSIYSSSAEHQ
ncbi:MAG: hypothetical protein M8364_12990 [Methylobacter sp.]|uniref:hypothetical protein n=1 Tax=Methylobacter sp. TaxID=2051955 RepID=UPI00258E27D1|nr:hypothetical protein [Methylobacter sp.]MCL7421811.1 hypothetical protein [Methylobacter sp.]